MPFLGKRLNKTSCPFEVGAEEGIGTIEGDKKKEDLKPIVIRTILKIKLWVVSPTNGLIDEIVYQTEN